jgi:hypothetical protein
MTLSPFHIRAVTCIAAIGVVGIGVVVLRPSLADAASQIMLSGVVTQNCTMSVASDPNAASLDLGSGSKHVVVGTILQNCNKTSGYTLNVASANCSASPTGAKVIGGTNHDYLKYSVESVNPTTGGSSADVTNLLNASCSNQTARTVTNAKITSETSTIYVNYTGSNSLSADTYTDTLTFTISSN